ncbi:MAG TPA: DUF72 domain-containing protein, partial [Longimicrobiales bacterium]|nr:DUF72 domain-containing protein [Longimicrobiales bacterium]
FYPDGLARKRELEYASRQLNVIEINGTFYSLQRPTSFETWHRQTPRGFRFAVKVSRFITHMKQLNDVATPLANFFASGILRLEEKLGPILWQFPPRMRYDRARFEAFLEMLPRTTADASRLARDHDARLEGRASFHCDVVRPIRYAFEVRHASFMNDDFVGLLREHDVALVFSDAAADWPYAEDVTTDFVYLRLHGADELYASGYGDDALDDWARKVKAWMRGSEPRGAARVSSHTAPSATGRDAWVFFDNDAKVRAPYDAMALADRLRIDWRRKHAE